MAITPKWHLVSEGRILDADSSDYVHVIADAGAPDGDADPQASAYQGSLYFRTDASDDAACLYCKVDTDSADDDWVRVMTDYTSDSYTRNGDTTLLTDKSIYLRDTGQRIYSSAADTGCLTLAASADKWRIGDTVGGNYMQIDYYGNVTFVGSARVNPGTGFTIFDDFLYGTLTVADTPWIALEGIDGDAALPVINDQECGVLRLVTGSGDGAFANDGSQIVCRVPVQADSGGLTFETRLHINTAITNISVFAGLTDITTLEEPFSNAADVITSNCTDGCGFLYDTSATTDTWWSVAVDGDADDAGSSTTAVAPVADTYQVLRMTVSTDGATILLYINGTLVDTLSGSNGVSPDVNLYATVTACGDGTASKVVDVDYIYVAHNR